MEGQLVTVTSEVVDRRHRQIRWAVAATFLATGADEPRCVDYRVRVVPSSSDGRVDIRDLHRTLRAMETHATTVEDAERLGSVPPEGIPRYVFEDASQAKLLAKARAAIDRNPGRFEAPAHAAIGRVAVNRGGEVRRGRPPRMSLGAKLHVLADLEDAYQTGRTRAEVAHDHHISESAVRDLLTWARHTAEPQLFTKSRPGVKGGGLTPEARKMLEGVRDGVDPEA